MRIGKRLFPYPTINNSRNASCFKNSSYSLEYVDYEDEKGTHLILKDACIVLNNRNLSNLINDGKAKAVLIVECSSTIFRKKYSISQTPIDIKIPLSNLRGKVEISSFIYATEEIKYYHDKDFLDDYEEYSFNIEKYDILAIDDGFTTKIDYDKSKDKKLSSIFLVVSDSNQALQTMRVRNADKQIIIYLPEKQFGIYDQIKINSSFQNIFFAIITIPALSNCLIELQKKDLDIEEIRMEHSWFSSIINGYKRIYGNELTEDRFKELNAFEFAQEVMNNATINSIGDVFDISFQKMLTGGVEDE